jgi:(S)-sulfolactate dehydrogenase
MPTIVIVEFMTREAVDDLVPDHDPAWRQVSRAPDLKSLLACADIVSLHVPRLPSTENLAAIAAMRPGAILINAARGGIVDGAALADALCSGRLGGAALDVLAVEPATTDSIARFKGLANLILTPPIAGPTIQSDIRVSQATADNVRRALSAPA